MRIDVLGWIQVLLGSWLARPFYRVFQVSHPTVVGAQQQNDISMDDAIQVGPRLAIGVHYGSFISRQKQRSSGF